MSGQPRRDTPAPRASTVMPPPPDLSPAPEGMFAPISEVTASKVHLDIYIASDPKNELIGNLAQIGRPIWIKTSDKFKINVKAMYFGMSEKDHPFDFDVFRHENDTRTPIKTGYKESQQHWGAEKLYPDRPFNASYTAMKTFWFEPLEPGYYSFCLYSWSTSARQEVMAKYKSEGTKKLNEELAKTEVSRVQISFGVAEHLPV